MAATISAGVVPVPLFSHVNRTDLNDVGSDALLFEFSRQRQNQILLCGFGSGIGPRFAGRIGHRGSRNDHHASPSIFDELRREGLEQMECRPHVLTEHEIQIFGSSLDESLAADPAADEMDEGVDSAKFRGNSLRRRADRVSIPQINHGREKTIRREIQVAGQRIQFILIVIEQNQ